jgi:hypothetical protein
MTATNREGEESSNTTSTCITGTGCVLIFRRDEERRAGIWNNEKKTNETTLR